MYQLHAGKCEHVLKSLPDNSVDSIVTDPPYGLNFMGKKWDYQVPTVEQWSECLRVLKPGGHLLAFGGSRTYHRLVVNIEDAGFEVRDQIMWLYGQGFPKSKNLTGEHKGKGTALKPAHEPIVLARKPGLSTIENTVSEFGTGTLNIDLCRIPSDDVLNGGTGGLLSHQRDSKEPESLDWIANDEGRWPANVLHDGSEAVVSAFPLTKSGSNTVKRATGSDLLGNTGTSLSAESRPSGTPQIFYGDEGSAARFFYCAKVSRTERDEGLERFVAVSASEMTGGRKEGSVGINDPRAGAGRTSGARNDHPTVKPVALMRYLCRLITPVGGKVLDPFMGSGSTGKAALLEGYEFIGIELDPDYLVTAAARIGHAYKSVEGGMNNQPQSKSPRKNVTEAVGVLLPGGGVKYATSLDKEIINGVPAGTPVRITPVKSDRFLKHHQKFIKLLELGFMYWEPDWAFVSSPENWIAHEVAKEVAEKAGVPEMYESITKDIAELVLSRVAEQRKKRFDAESIKTMSAYFNHVMCKAGFFDLAVNPDGGTFKQRWSIAFANMSQEKFNQVYKGVCGVIWNETLSQHFSNYMEMEQALDRLREYM